MSPRRKPSSGLRHSAMFPSQGEESIVIQVDPSLPLLQSVPLPPVCSGKVGVPELEGIIPRTCKEIFRRMELDAGNPLITQLVDVQVHSCPSASHLSRRSAHRRRPIVLGTHQPHSEASFE